MNLSVDPYGHLRADDLFYVHSLTDNTWTQSIAFTHNGKTYRVGVAFEYDHLPPKRGPVEEQYPNLEERP